MTITAQDIATIAQSMTTLVGESNVFTWDTISDRWKAQIIKAIAPNHPVACLVLPATPEELSNVITDAHHHQIPVLPCGNGSKLAWGGLIAHSPLPTPHSPLLVVSTSRLNQLIDHAIGDLTVTVEAGISFVELQEVLAKAGQFLAIDPSYPQAATIGGIVATADTGSLRQRYNSVRDMLLGVSFVRADGQLAKAGGRVVKNVAGYDLMKLLTGSYGTLGILTQLTFRVYPIPETSQTIVVTGDANEIAQLAQTLLPSALTPTSMDLLSANVIQDLNLGSGAGLAVRFQSIAASVEEQISKVKELGQSLQLSSIELRGNDEAALWQHLSERMTQSVAADTIACKIGIQPSQASVLLQAVERSLPGGFLQVHAASGLGRLLVNAISPDQLLPLRAICQEHQGFLTVLEAPVSFKQQIDVWGYSGNGLDVMRRIKQQFDTQRILSPDRFVGGI